MFFVWSMLFDISILGKWVNKRNTLMFKPKEKLRYLAQERVLLNIPVTYRDVGNYQNGHGSFFIFLAKICVTCHVKVLVLL